MRLAIAGIILVASLIATPQLMAQPADQPSSEELRQAALKWMDEYLAESALFKKEDIKKLRDQVLKMTPAQLDAWVTKTQSVREILESEQWQKTNAWMKQFLQVQAIYSEQEIDELRATAGEATPEELIEILEKIEAKHRQLTWMHSVSERNRAASVKSTQQTVQQQAAAARSAAKRSSSNRPLFGTTTAKASAKSKYAGRGVPAPLITSKEVARGVVRREVFRGYGGGRGW